MKSKWQCGKGRKNMSVISLDDARKKLEKAMNSTSQSTQSSQSDKAGQKHIDDETMLSLAAMYECLARARFGGFTTKSAYARRAATSIAVAATEDLITTKVSEDIWGNRWIITEFGNAYMREIEDDVIS